MLVSNLGKGAKSLVYITSIQNDRRRGHAKSSLKELHTIGSTTVSLHLDNSMTHTHLLFIQDGVHRLFYGSNKCCITKWVRHAGWCTCFTTLPSTRSYTECVKIVTYSCGSNVLLLSHRKPNTFHTQQLDKIRHTTLQPTGANSVPQPPITSLDILKYPAKNV